MYDTLIIGAGMSGLAAGIRLAYFERPVCILEQHTTIGGLNSFYRLDGRNYDVGLHALTNFTPKGTHKGPLARMCRQLRISWDDLALVPQLSSAIAFPGTRLEFSNEFDYFREEISRAFPDQMQGFDDLVAALIDYTDAPSPLSEESARAVVGRYLSDPLLQEMIFCPMMFYGNAREHDMEFGAFSILFRSIFLEGLSRPFGGVRLILKQLVKKFRGLGGHLRLRSRVDRIEIEDGRAVGVTLTDGTEIASDRVMSSAGWCETMQMCGDEPAENKREPGRLSFLESVSTLDCQPKELGINNTIVFFNDSKKFHWRVPDELVDASSGVICSPNNFAYDKPLAEGVVRVTSLANYQQWRSLSPPEYEAAKKRWYDRVAAAAVRIVPDFRSRVVATDVFTPTTIERFTLHQNGAVYGTPSKRYDGTTHLKNLFICGTDQGWVGIIGAIVSGISMANKHVLRGS